jgi:5-methyltetrahydrofolate--homocysteine methyltransferase
LKVNLSFFSLTETLKIFILEFKQRGDMDFYSLLKSNETILLDGAMGTELDKRGVLGRSDANLTHPEIVTDIHREYFRAGSQAVITNTFAMSRIYIETHKLKVDVAEVNLAGVKLARSAAGDVGYVLGDLGSTAQLLEPYGTYKEKDIYDTFKEQASLLVEGGVDAFIIETMFDLREALCALRACKDASSIPVIASMAFQTETKGGRTMMGNSAEECVVRLTEEGADVVGTNCGELDPLQMSKIIGIFKKSTSLPIMAEPNAGKPVLKDGKVFYMEPGTFAAGALECCRAGARLIGGCCGTSPAHIRALSELIQKVKIKES